jgi:replicative DNA helicase
MIYDKRNAAVVLGCLLQQPSLLAETDSFSITTDDFADRLHRIIFSTVFNMFHSGVEQITINEINAYLKAYPELYVTFNDLKGNDAILTAMEISQVGNFQYYYDKLKKLSLLRSLESSGFDVNEWYVADTYDIGKRQQLEEKLEKSTINEIVQFYMGKISNIESKFVNRQSFNFGSAFEGIIPLLERLKEQPEIGIPIQGEILTTITRGSRKSKFYILSAASGRGKSRAMVGHSCFMSYPFRWDLQKEDWVVSGSASKTLFITTELDRSEIQTMILAYLSGVNEEKILNGSATIRELERINIATQIMQYYKDNLLIYHMPDPNVTQLNSNIRRLVITHQIRNVVQIEDRVTPFQ